MKISKPLTSKQKKRLISIAWEQVEGFISDWQKSPHEWYGERDIQVEIASRIKRMYRRHKIYIMEAKYKKGIDERYKGKKQKYSRVTCEPPVYHRYRGSKHDTYRPDIVVWDDIKNPDSPCEDNYKKKKNENMLWVCEIKYRPQWKKAYNPQKRDNEDLKKLKYLLNQPDGTEYACWLNIAYKVDKSCRDDFDNKPHAEGRLTRYCVTLPSIKH